MDMNTTPVIAVFDIGKTNKKFLLFNEQLKLEFVTEQFFPTTKDEDGFECDDIELIEKWIVTTLITYLKSKQYEVVGVNFATFGASLAFVDKQGNRLTPIYNYLKEIPATVQNSLFEKYGGEKEFCRKTASPALGLLLNSGTQIEWLKQEKSEIFNRAAHILHFPQYLSYLFTQSIVSEYTSIGCHTFLWDFDNNSYHSWLSNEGINLPQPEPNNYTTICHIADKNIRVGLGIHDSSSSLAPYILGSKEKFLLVSTGTWCINMNPYNHSPLTEFQLKNDCLSYLSIDRKPVKSSRLFMGHIHDVNTERLSRFFNLPEGSYKNVKTDESLIASYLKEVKKNVFFKNGVPDNYIDESIDLKIFNDFSEAYHRLMFDLTLLNKKSIDLIMPNNDGIKAIYVSGGFARNEIFVRLLAGFYPDKKVFTSEIDNSSALGAALVIWESFSKKDTPEIDLGLKEWKGFLSN